ncbi:MAG: heavy-metal-associated domain-containing protein [Thiobacillaceae bacterium]|nr:heavy-metal-associated domain-containing protein [Thiobacillaceae bacterium]MCX7673810.1 heavy-metal-associated domain-containing protein [Thiobacillaceae bacterium]MDW8323568.1 heavy-metal-associated domain-containing protein [Burkholderiales bacterium]
MQELNLKVGGMSCGGCVASVKRLLGAIEGVAEVDVDLAQGRVRVRYDPYRAGPDALKRAIEDGGYQVLDEV